MAAGVSPSHLRLRCSRSSWPSTGYCLRSIHTGSNNALTDDQDHAFPPYGYDLSNGGFYGPPKMLPGSAQQFAVYFRVPKGINLKDLVFTLTAYGDDHPVDVRVSLKQ